MRPICIGILLSAFMAPAAASAAAPGPTPAVDGIVRAFDSATLVMLGEQHWSKIDSDLRMKVVDHPDFPSHVDDIVVEFANAAYQDLLDAYVLDLKPIPYDSLRWVWRNTTQPGTWDSPVYAHFIDHVRRRNMRLRPEDRLRILAGDPPIDWARVRNYEDTEPWRERIVHAVGVIEREVLVKDRKALIVYGLQQLVRVNRAMNDERNLTNMLRSLFPDVPTYVVGTIPVRSSVAKRFETSIDPKLCPVLMRAGSTSLGHMPSVAVYEFGGGTLKQMVDALIYMGPVSDRVMRPRDDVLRDVEYKNEIVRRKAIVKTLPRDFPTHIEG